MQKLKLALLLIVTICASNAYGQMPLTYDALFEVANVVENVNVSGTGTWTTSLTPPGSWVNSSNAQSFFANGNDVVFGRSGAGEGAMSIVVDSSVNSVGDMTIANVPNLTYSFSGKGILGNRLFIDGDENVTTTFNDPTTGSHSFQNLTLFRGTLAGTATISVSSGMTVQSGGIDLSLSGTGSITKTTTGDVSLNATNSYSGGTNVNAGSLSANAIDALGSGAVSVGSGATLNVFSDNAVGVVSLLGGTIDGGATLSGTSYSFQSGTVNASLGNANLTKTTAGTLTLNSSNSFQTVALTGGSIDGFGSITADTSFALQSGSIDNTLSGNASLTKSTVGTVAITGVGNSFSGGTTVSAGVLNANSVGALGMGNVSIDTGATLNLGANDVIDDFASVMVSGNLNIGTFTDTVGSLTVDGGSITGSGTLTTSSLDLLSGTITANLVVAGNVAIANGATLQSDLTINSATILSGAGTINGDLVFDSGAFLDLDSSLTNILTVSGTMNFSNFTLDSLLGFDWQNAAAGTYRLINGGSAIFDANSNTISNRYDFGDGRFGYFQSGSLDLIITAVPEPSSMMLVILGTAGLAIRRRARR